MRLHALVRMHMQCECSTAVATASRLHTLTFCDVCSRDVVVGLEIAGWVEEERSYSKPYCGFYVGTLLRRRSDCTARAASDRQLLLSGPSCCVL